MHGIYVILHVYILFQMLVMLVPCYSTLSGIAICSMEKTSVCKAHFFVLLKVYALVFHYEITAK